MTDVIASKEDEFRAEKGFLPKDLVCKTVTVGQQVDALHAAREEKRKIEATLKDQNARIDEMERDLLAKMEQQGLYSAKGEHGTVSVQTLVKPHVTDWDAFYRYIARMKYWHLLERRPSATGCRELFEKHAGQSGDAIPGVVPFEKRQINLRSNN